MPASELQKKAVVFIIIAGIAVIALAAMPFFEHWLQTVFFPSFGWSFESNWQLTPEKRSRKYDGDNVCQPH